MRVGWTVWALVAGCDGIVGGTVYCCTYESRYTGCGGVGWNDWEAEQYEFDLEDYKDGWDAERVCDKFTGSATECGGGCCIEVQYQNTELARGTCASGS